LKLLNLSQGGKVFKINQWLEEEKVYYFFKVFFRGMTNEFIVAGMLHKVENVGHLLLSHTSSVDKQTKFGNL
jgi:hypothetical protein